MIDILLNLGFIEDDLNTLLKEVKVNDIDIAKTNIDILKSINISDDTIKNIIITNPSIFNNDSNTIIELIEKFKIYGFDDLDNLFNKNPMILNSTSYELGIFVNEKIDSGLTIEEIIESINENPFIMDEE